MSNKDYKELYQKLQKENIKLKLELENKIALIDFIYEEVDFLSNKIEKMYNEAISLQHSKKELYNKIKDFSDSMDLELENKINKNK